MRMVTRITCVDFSGRRRDHAILVRLLTYMVRYVQNVGFSIYGYRCSISKIIVEALFSLCFSSLSLFLRSCFFWLCYKCVEYLFVLKGLQWICVVLNSRELSELGVGVYNPASPKKEELTAFVTNSEREATQSDRLEGVPAPSAPQTAGVVDSGRSIRKHATRM